MGAIYTPAQKKATEKYLKEKTEEIKIRVKKGQREVIKEKAKRNGYSSMSSFILDAIKKFNQEEQ